MPLAPPGVGAGTALERLLRKGQGKMADRQNSVKAHSEGGDHPGRDTTPAPNIRVRLTMEANQVNDKEIVLWRSS